MTAISRDANDPTRWTEADSERFAALGDLYVPAREEQRRVLLDSIPADNNDVLTMVELGAGDGTFARSVLEQFPRCRVLALDGSDVMLERAGSWRRSARGLGCVSSRSSAKTGGPRYGPAPVRALFPCRPSSSPVRISDRCSSIWRGVWSRAGRSCW